MDMSPRWGFSSFGVVGYKDAAPPELKHRFDCIDTCYRVIQPPPITRSSW
jgi:hypothetical protein